MRFGKKAVSPLIATIMLIALTVAIGAIIIGWGKSYVQQRTSCLGAAVDIYSSKLNNTQNGFNIEIVASNSGNQKILLKNIEVIIYDNTGQKHVCPWENIEGCKISTIQDPSTNTNLNQNNYWNPGNYTKITVFVSSKVQWANNLPNSYVTISLKGCGEISTKSLVTQ